VADAANWRKLRDAVDGNLIEVRAMFESCATEPNGAACREATQDVKNPYWLGDQAAALRFPDCSMGGLRHQSAYAIRAQNTADVVAGVNFVRENNLRLVIKGGGHSYYGTSNAPDSLLIGRVR